MYKVNGYFYTDEDTIKKYMNMTDEELEKAKFPRYKLNLLRPIKWYQKTSRVTRRGKTKKVSKIFKN